MQHAEDDALDLDKVAYFRTRYGGLDDEELTELAGRRDSLADEAAEALDTIIAARGISVTALASTGTPAPETPVQQQISLAKELWAGPASRTGQFLCMVACGSVASQLARQLPGFGSSPGHAGAGAVLAGLVVVIGRFLGYRIGRYFTREICANGDKPIAQRRSALRWFAVGVAVAYFVVSAVLAAALPRA